MFGGGKSRHMKIIHISGSPGAGKSILGQVIAAMYSNIGQRVAVFDVDAYIQHDTPGGKELMKLVTNDKGVYNARWKAILDEQIAQHLQRETADILVLTGILNNFSWDGEYYMENADLKLFVHLPVHELLRIYYTRAASNAQNWHKVADRTHIIESSDRLIDHAHYDMRAHVLHGYTVVDDALPLVKSFIDTHLQQQ